MFRRWMAPPASAATPRCPSHRSRESSWQCAPVSHVTYEQAKKLNKLYQWYYGKSAIIATFDIKAGKIYPRGKFCPQKNYCWEKFLFKLILPGKKNYLFS
jgi:hypothetical protein